MKNMDPKKDESDEYEMIAYFKINYNYTYCMFTNDMQNKYSFNKNEQRIKKNHFE
jgi:hypothetical protein